jgi:L-ascorbate metabolism protein UlaG (beta-lactamase superfamily)
VQFTWHSSASISLTKNGSKILFDPWLSDSAFLGSWRPWPDPTSAKNNVISQDFDFIIYTHFHSDHYDSKFLKEYFNFNKKRLENTEILIVESVWNQLEFSIRNLIKGIRVRVVSSGIRIKISEDFYVTLFTSDWCEPQVCGKLIPCYSTSNRSRAIDSVALIEGSGTKILNLNDAVGSTIVNHLVRNGLRVDLVLGVYGAAGSFPQCLDISDDLSSKLSEDFIDNALNTLVSKSLMLKARYILPFAGQYILVGRLSKLNSKRALLPLPEAVNRLKNTFESVITLEPNGIAEFKNGLLVQKSLDYNEPSLMNQSKYLLKYEDQKYYYERRILNDQELDKAKMLSRDAFDSLASRYEPNQIPGDLYAINIFSPEKEHVFGVRFTNQDVTYSSSPIDSSNFSDISLDLRLLVGVLSRKAGYKSFTSMHWNQAHIGSHLTFTQSNYDARAHYFLNFLHT